MLMVRVTGAGTAGNRVRRSRGLKTASRSRGQTAARERDRLIECARSRHLKCNRSGNTGLVHGQTAGRRSGEIEIHDVQRQSKIAGDLIGVSSHSVSVEKIIADRSARAQR